MVVISKIYDENKFVTGWAGDSRVVLCRKGRACGCQGLAALGTPDEKAGRRWAEEELKSERACGQSRALPTHSGLENEVAKGRRDHGSEQPANTSEDASQRAQLLEHA